MTTTLKWLCEYCGATTRGASYQRDICGRCRHPRDNAKPVEQPKRRAILDSEVRPLAWEIPKPAPRQEGDVVTALLYGDTHFPHQDDAALAVVQSIATEMTPDWLVHMGDLLDCYNFSRFDKDPMRKDSQQDEIDMGRKHLATMRLASPSSRFVYLEGNHEDRLRRTLWNLEGPSAVLAKLTAFQKAITWPALLGLDDLGVTFVPYGEQSQHAFLPKFILKHGTVVRGTSAYTAHGEWKKYGKSGASGHTHRLGQFYHRDHNGNHVWLETGCTCALNPEYAPDPDWQQGAVFMSFERQTGAFQAETIYIHRGRAVFRGKVYGGAEDGAVRDVCDRAECAGDVCNDACGRAAKNPRPGEAA